MSNSAFTPQSNITAPADASTGGIVSTTAQVFAGVKTFQDAPVISSASGIVAATASVPGVVTTATQAFAGNKTFSGLLTATGGVDVNTITEITATNGVQVQGRTSATAIASGYIGQKVNFTSVAITPATVGTIAYAGQLCASLPAGIWLLVWRISADCNGTSASVAEGWISTTTAADGTGRVSDATSLNTYPLASGVGSFGVAGQPVYYQITSATNLYAKVATYGTASRSVAMGGFAIRIA